MLNQVVLVGRLTKNPEIINTESGKKISYIVLAVQRPFKNADALYETDFIRCILWNAMAENTCEYCKCGDVIGVKGRVQAESYTDEDGNVKYSTDVVAERITFLSSSSTSKKENIENKKEK